MKDVLLKPRLSEKSYGISEKGVYVVDVPSTLNKHGVTRAIEAQFSVKVVKVNVINVKGKAKRTVSLSGKRRVNSEGSRSNVKKAYVTLKDGDKLPFFEAVEAEEKKQENTQKQIDKAVDKQAAKDTKQPKR